MSNLLNIEEIKKKIKEISISELKEIEEITEEFNTKIVKIKEKAIQKRSDLKKEIENEVKKIENMFPFSSEMILELDGRTIDNSTYYHPNTTTTKPKPTRSGSVVR